MQVVNPWEREGIRAGGAALALRLLTKKIGPLPTRLAEQIGDLSREQLEQLSDVMLDFATVEQLQSWLSQNA